jgi:hypothetical protein
MGSGYFHYIETTSGQAQDIEITNDLEVGNATTTKTISATDSVTSASGLFTTLLSGVTVTGLHGNFSSDVTAQTVDASVKISGLLITGNTGQFTDLTTDTLTANDVTITGDLNFGADFTTTGNISGATISGVSGVFNDYVSAPIANFTTVTGSTSVTTEDLTASGTITGSAAGVTIQGPLTILP